MSKITDILSEVLSGKLTAKQIADKIDEAWEDDLEKNPPQENYCQCGSCQEAIDAALRQAKLLWGSGHCAAWLIQVGQTLATIGRDGLSHRLAEDGDYHRFQTLVDNMERDMYAHYMRNRKRINEAMASVKRD
jgi:hypothetical protein